MASARELMEKIDAFKNVQEAVDNRIAAIKTPEEEREVNSLIKELSVTNVRSTKSTK